MRHIIRQGDVERRERQLTKQLPEELKRWLIDDNPEMTKDQKEFVDDFPRELKKAVEESKNARTEA